MELTVHLGDWDVLNLDILDHNNLHHSYKMELIKEKDIPRTFSIYLNGIKLTEINMKTGQ